jgi:hypothetical protein
MQGFKLAYEAKRCKILFIKIVYVNSKFGIFVGMLSFGYARFNASTFHIKQRDAKF